MESAGQGPAARRRGAGKGGPIREGVGSNEDDGNAVDAVPPRRNHRTARHGNSAQDILRSESTERDRDSEECDDPDEEKRETKESERRQILDRQEDSEEWLTHTDGIVASSLAE